MAGMLVHFLLGIPTPHILPTILKSVPSLEPGVWSVLGGAPMAPALKGAGQSEVCLRSQSKMAEVKNREDRCWAKPAVSQVGRNVSKQEKSKDGHC